MIRKLVYKVPSRTPGDTNDAAAASKWRAINASLHTSLKATKDSINSHHGNHSWDHYKKLSNEFEFVFTSNTCFPSSSRYIPVSRSFFKLWEMLHDFRAEMSVERPMCVAFLAEGPGGFVEAFFRFRQQEGMKDDRMFGMTLHSADRKVPTWRISQEIQNHMQVCRGTDGTGSLYNPDNVQCLINMIGAPNSCDLVTADGGFDFSYDFNNQEIISQKLLAAEVHAALRLQREGGTFVLKIYDVSTPETISTFNVLLECYKDVYVVKPLTSRPANSEKYVVCCGFRSDIARSFLDTLLSPTGAYPDEWVTKHVASFNHYFVTRQIMYITKTILCIQLASKGLLNERSLMHRHQALARAWCKKYGIT
jgi:23S rRNA U2552 (ribose-2'-O)-methylase RlmE/FtsJ